MYTERRPIEQMSGVVVFPLDFLPDVNNGILVAELPADAADMLEENNFYTCGVVGSSHYS